MDNDMISRSALLDCIGDVGNDPEDDTTFLTIGQACAIAHKSIVDMVKAAPAVDPSTLRPTGRWTLNRDGSGTCSECHRTRNDVWDMDNWDNFCSHCGADMRGEANDK